MTGNVQRARQKSVVEIGVHFGFYTIQCCALRSGAACDVFGVHGDEVVYDDGAHGKGTEGVGEGV